MKIIMPQGDRKFIVYENQVPGKFLNLNFANLVDGFGLTSGVIVHWQSKTEPYREWGLYDVAADSYNSALEFSVGVGIDSQSLSLPDGWGYVPSAVIFYKDAKVVVAEDGSISIAPVPIAQPNFEI